MSHRLQHASCEACIFYAEAHIGSTVRQECRRYPPKKEEALSGSPVYASWPTVDPDDWCGEYESKYSNESLPGK